MKDRAMYSVLAVVSLVAAMLLGTVMEIGAASTTAEPQKVFRWKMTIPGGYTGTYKAFSDAFTDSVRDASGGRLLIRTHGVGDLYPWNETWDAVNRGASEMALIQTGAAAGVDPAFDIADHYCPVVASDHCCNC